MPRQEDMTMSGVDQGAARAAEMLGGTALGKDLDAAEERALTRRKPELTSAGLAELAEFGEVVARSKMFQDLQTTAQATLKMMVGAELGLTKTASLTSVHVFDAGKGRTQVMVGAHLIRAKIDTSRDFRVKVLKRSMTECVILAFRRGGDFGNDGDQFLPVGTFCEPCSGTGKVTVTKERPPGLCMACYGHGVEPVRFGTDDAKRMGLLGKDNWQKDPASMCYARCIALTQRLHFPELLAIGPVYVPEEFEDVDIPRTLVAAADQNGKESEVTVQRPRRAPAAPPPDAIDVTAVGQGAEPEGAPTGEQGPILDTLKERLQAAEAVVTDTLIEAGAGGGDLKVCNRTLGHPPFRGLFCPACMDQPIERKGEANA